MRCNMSIKVLLVEDEDNIRQFTKINLAREGFEILEAESGEKGVELAELNKPDVAVLDIMLPGIDGFEVCKILRNKFPNMIIIMLTAKTQDNDKIEGLDNGADDYLIKPFHIKELSARIRALVRRPPQIKENLTLEIDDLSLNLASHELSCNHTSLLLTPKEFHLIQIFLSSPGTIFSREQLLQKVWNTNDEVEPGNVDNYIYFLRKRLKCLNSNCCINSVYGSGYSLEVKHD